MSDVRVVKVGGSLFDYAELPVALHKWLTRHSESLHVLVAGGGDLAETIRKACVRFGLDPTAAHWICIDLLTASARMLAALLPAAQFVSTYAGLQLALQRGEPAVLAFAVADFLHGVEPQLPGPSLPHAWSVTSDSIAARLASALNARELVLMKSRDVSVGLTTQEAARWDWSMSFSPSLPPPYPPSAGSICGPPTETSRCSKRTRQARSACRAVRSGTEATMLRGTITTVPRRAELPLKDHFAEDACRKTHCLPSWSIERHGR